MRCAITRVLPEPAPAKISSGPSLDPTASRCCSLSWERKSIIVIWYRAQRPLTTELFPLEKLHGALVFLCGFERVECAEISALAGFGILLARVKTILARLQFPDHRMVILTFE